MKLYYSTGSCSMSCHIALEEAGLTYTGVEASWDRNENIQEIEKLNPLGVVPVFVNDQGKVLTQNAAILEYIADAKPDSRLLADKGTWERVETASWLSFVAADFHKAFGPLFMASQMATSPDAQNEIKVFTREKIKGYLEYLNTNLAGKDYLTGKTFTIADAYLFTVLGWCKWLEVPTSGFANVTSYMKRVLARPAVQKVVTIHDMASEYV